MTGGGRLAAIVGRAGWAHNVELGGRSRRQDLPARPLAPSSDSLPAPLDESADDQQLVDACLAGHREAFDVLVVRHQRMVYRLCYRFVGTHEDASDLTQDVFVRAFRGLKGFRGRSTVTTWLYRIGVNVCLNRLSSRKAEFENLEPERHVDDTRLASDDRVLQREEAERVRAAIARLPKRQRATLILRVYHELSHDEISRVLGNSVGAVKANFFHALRNLKRLLEGRSER